MIQSQYILDIFDLTFDKHTFGDLLRNQISFLTLKEIDHTGIGAFIHFKADIGVEKFKLDTSNSKNFDIEGNTIELIDGIQISNPNLLILADAVVHLKNGIIDHLEIWNKSGEDYVAEEPKYYELEQMLSDKGGQRKIVR